MTLQTYIPQPALRPFIHLLWYWEGYYPAHRRERILPAGMMELVINLADEPMCMYYPEDGFQPHLIYGSIVAGARSELFFVDTSRPTSVLSAWFKPGAALPFFNVGGYELHNRHIPLDVVWGNAAHTLYCRLLDARTTSNRFQLLEAVLLQRLYRVPESIPNRHRAVNFALTLFDHSPSTHTIQQVQAAIALSPTRFIQVFREDIGLTPKLFCRVQRFQQALRLIASQQIMNWAEVALTCGYYDQAHFINDFHHFAGITPTQYFPQSRDHYSNLAVIE